MNMNFLLYLGGGLIWWAKCQFKGKRPMENPHFIHILEIQLLQWLSLAIFLVVFGIQTLIIRHFRDWAVKIPLEISFYVLGACGLICLIFRMEGIFAALIGKNPLKILPFKVIEKKHQRFMGLMGIAGNHLMLILVVFIAVHSNSMATQAEVPAQVYMLYDDMGYVPRWVFTTGFYPEIIESKKRFGPNSVAVMPLTKDAVDQAVSNGKLIYIAAHGADGGIYLPAGIFMWPEDIGTYEVNADLQYVYLSACDSGYKKDEWEAAFEPARVITFNRLSTVVEHVDWLMFEGPKVISELD